MPEHQQRELAERAVAEGMTAVEMENIVRLQTADPSKKIARCGVAARQRKFRTSRADVLITFRKKSATDADVIALFEELLADRKRSESSLTESAGAGTLAS